MVEILKSFEQVASRFSPAVLIVPGLVMAVLGLVTWLAGMCLRRLVLALVGATAIGLAGFFFGKQNPAIACLAAVGGAGFGATVPRLFVAVFLAGLGAAVTLALLARAHPVREGLQSGARNLDGVERRLTTRESLDIVQMYVLDVADRVRAIARGLPPTDLAIVAGVGVGLIAVGLLLARLAGALTCSVLGTGLVFTGLMLLLIHKGSTPIARMEQQGPFFGLVLLAMVAFGTLEHLLLCPSPRRRNAPAGRSRSRRQESQRGWRGR